jgi:hypothetical protein
VSPVIQDLSVAAGLLAAMVVGLEAGYRSGRRAAKAEPAGAGSQVGAIQAAVLGLLGLLLAFSFAAAGSRFLERQDLIALEANAIGTAWLRAELLGEPHRSELRAALEAYTAHRIAISSHMRYGWEQEQAAEVERLHGRMWRAASAGVARQTELAVAMLTPVNEVLDLHSLRIAATRKHLPLLVVWLLVVSSVLAVAVIGYGCGMDGRHRWNLTLSLAILIVGALWVTIDLDHPRRGLLQLNDAPLRELKFQ